MKKIWSWLFCPITSKSKSVEDKLWELGYVKVDENSRKLLRLKLKGERTMKMCMFARDRANATVCCYEKEHKFLIQIKDGGKVIAEKEFDNYKAAERKFVELSESL